MDTVEKTGKTVEEAVEAALRTLEADRSEVDIEIIEVGAKGFLGIGSKLAQVKITRKFDPERIAAAFIKEMASAMNITVNVDTKSDERGMYVTLSGENMGILIGKRGQTLDAIQYLVSLAVNKGTAPYMSVTVDSENYRGRRKEILEQLAMSLARKVKSTRRSVTLEPMNTFERRIIHAKLQNDRQVSTYSEGADPYRNIVIAPKKRERDKDKDKNKA